MAGQWKPFMKFYSWHHNSVFDYYKMGFFNRSKSPAVTVQRSKPPCSICFLYIYHCTLLLLSLRTFNRNLKKIVVYTTSVFKSDSCSSRIEGVRCFTTTPLIYSAIALILHVVY